MYLSDRALTKHSQGLKIEKKYWEKNIDVSFLISSMHF
jgi:hypothetical protein